MEFVTTASYTEAEYLSEYGSFVNSPEWELKNVVRALTSFRWLNTSAQEARLAAVKNIRKQNAASKRRRAAQA